MVLRHASDCAEKIGSSSSEEVDPVLDLESGLVYELNKRTPGAWRFPRDPDLCCIYRVPNSMYQMSPEAYTPQLVLIGPLNHSLRSPAFESRGNITHRKLMGYSNMEEHKKIYLGEFTRRFKGEKIIGKFRRVIEEEEDKIRASYSESTAWIESPNFVEMILHDSVFILELMLRSFAKERGKIGDHLMDEPCLKMTIKGDLIMLENQLPYFILEKLFDPVAKIINQTLHQLVINYFGLKNTKISDQTKFRHFTDLVRCVRVDGTLTEEYGSEDPKPNYKVDNINAHKLDNWGVKFKAMPDAFLVKVNFNSKHGCLEIPHFRADDSVEITFRNIMALEQCHYPYNAQVCSYIIFLDFIIDTAKDVELLVEKGIITNLLGNHGVVAKMVNKLCLGVPEDGAYYSEITEQVTAYYKSKYNKSRAILNRVYCSDMWSGIATVGATLLLLLTLIQTVTSVIEVLSKK